jgi:hypothetical protein
VQQNQEGKCQTMLKFLAWVLLLACCAFAYTKILICNMAENHIAKIPHLEYVWQKDKKMLNKTSLQNLKSGIKGCGLPSNKLNT